MAAVYLASGRASPLALGAAKGNIGHSEAASGLMGVRPTKPAWAQWVVRPAPGNLTSVQIAVPTPQGIITANFSRSDRDSNSVGGTPQLLLHVSIPSGTEATACMPLYGATAGQFTLMLNGVATTAGQLDHGTYICLGGLKQPQASVAVVPRPQGSAAGRVKRS